MGEVELDNDGENKEQSNPSAELCAAAKSFRAHLVELGIPSPEISMVEISWDDDDREPRMAVICRNYVPGPAELGWPERNVRLLV